VEATPHAILLVEDNSDHAELITRGLKDHPVASKIVHVRDGEVALDYLFRRREYRDPEKSPRPHLILLDLRLPRIDGLEVLQQIKAREDLRPIPVVILTTSEAEKDVELAYDHHVNSYLVKPLGFEDLTGMIRDLGRYWLGWNHLPRSF
jgi:CheY-like chemotaxis protein